LVDLARYCCAQRNLDRTSVPCPWRDEIYSGDTPAKGGKLEPPGDAGLDGDITRMSPKLIPFKARG